MNILPIKNTRGFFEIRLESIGGLGANLAGKMLAEAGVLGQGFNGTNFSSYGSEKKGTPVKSFVRFSDSIVEIRDHSPIEQPHVIGIFHETLYQTVDVFKGIRNDGIVLINSARTFDEIIHDLKIPCRTLAKIDALSIAVEEKTRLNTAMLGALYRIIDFLEPNYMLEIIRKTFQKKAPELAEANIRTFQRGYDEVQFITTSQSSCIEEKRRLENINTNIEIGGIITTQANSLTKDMSSSRLGFLPALYLDKCIHCAQCDIVCPDFCFVWDETLDKRGRKQMILKGIDYQYCKGCLKCVNACPTAALEKIRETPSYVQEHRIKQDKSHMEVQR